MNDKLVRAPFRLAIRQEGSMINAYFAADQNMEGAVLMGSILASLCDRDRAIFETWKALMSKALKNTVTDILGVAAEMREEPAPEHERAGHA